MRPGADLRWSLSFRTFPNGSLFACPGILRGGRPGFALKWVSVFFPTGNSFHTFHHQFSFVYYLVCRSHRRRRASARSCCWSARPRCWRRDPWTPWIHRAARPSSRDFAWAASSDSSFAIRTVASFLLALSDVPDHVVRYTTSLSVSPFLRSKGPQGINTTRTCNILM